MVKRILAVCLALVISCTVAIKPLNVEAAAESGILGGALAAMGVSLSVPQIALLVAAAGGAVYLYENREAVADSLETFLEVASENIEERKEQLQEWWKAAKLGHIAISTAQDWIKQSVKDWIGGLHDGSTHPNLSSGGTAVDHKGYPLVENGTTLSGTQTVSYDLDGYITCNSPTIFKYYWINEENTEAFDVYVTTVILKKRSNSMDYSENGGDNVFTTTLQYFGSGSSQNGAGKEYFRHYTLTDSVRISQLKTFLQGGRAVDYYTAKNYKSYAQKTGFVYTCNNPIITSLAPAASVGGVKNVISDGYSMDDIYFDDLEFVGYGYISADTTKTGEAVFEESITNTLTGMQAGTITWTDYLTDVSTAPTVTVPDATDQTITNDFVIGNTGVTDTVVTPAVDPPELENYKVQLKDFFPFCLPFDIVSFIGVLAAEPEAPKMDFTLPWIDGEGFTFTIDLSKWDPVAEILRTMELLALIVGLGFKTREMIRG